MTDIDRIAMDEYGLDLLQMMENAGGAMARVVRRLWPQLSRVTVLAGRGGNGGGALAAARRMRGFGLEVSVVLDRTTADLAGAAAHQAATLRAMDVELSSEPGGGPHNLVVDGLIGYGLDRAPRGRTAELIEWSRSAGSVVSLDIPSGLDATTGWAHGPHISPEVTVTLALPKTGLSLGTVGRLLLADIGIPPDLYMRHFGMDYLSVFSEGDIVDVTHAPLRPVP